MIEGNKVEKAAIQFNGKLYVGERHADIMYQIWDEYQTTQVKILQEHQGFLDSEGKFLNRFQAGALAFRAGQTKVRHQSLLSEHVW